MLDQHDIGLALKIQKFEGTRLFDGKGGSIVCHKLCPILLWQVQLMAKPALQQARCEEDHSRLCGRE